MIGTKFYKGEFSADEYSQAADWCNLYHTATIVDMGEYYEVVALPEPTLQEVKEKKIVELKGHRDTEEVSPILVNGHLFDYDDKARERINAAIIALDLTQGEITWTLADNTDTVVTSTDLKYVVAMVAQRSNELHIKYRGLRSQVDQATTKAEVESIVWGD